MATYSSDKMRDMPVGKLLFSMAIPAMLSMLVKALYNIVDSIYVSRFSAEGLEALSIVFPLQTIVIALAIAISVGTNALVSRKLGEQQHEEANKIAGNGILLTVFGMIAIMILAIFLPRPFMCWFTDNNQIILDGIIYLQIILFFSFGCFFEIILCRILQAVGNMKIPMISQILGAVVNIILDPLFIFGFWFIPSMGVMGAAIATIIGQLASFVFVTIYYFSKKQEITISFKYLKPKWSYIGNISKIALPTFIMNSINSLVTTFMNLIIKDYQYAITIHGIYFKLRSFAYMPVFGLTQGLMPILSYNYGANLKPRFDKAHRIATFSSFAILFAGAALFFCFPRLFLSLFNIEGEALKLGVYSLRVLSISFIGSAFCIMASTTLQSLGVGFGSLLITLSRQVVIALPAAFILSWLWGVDGVFFCYVIAETLVAFVSYPIEMVVTRRKFAKKALIKPTV